ncbi:MAG: DUF3800 domain-containing protein [Deltaproteobacteria bacterium]|nr:DUF3800 domain-containing protein [Deltaproteobacteria bacterium]
MLTYVDEAGVFVVPSNKDWAVSCVGALTILEQDEDEIFGKFETIKEGWGGDSSVEYKGRHLNEFQVREVIDMLSEFSVILNVTAIDMATQTDSAITRHRMNQAKEIVRRVTDELHPNLVKELHELKKEFEELSNQLYVQSVCSLELLYNVVQTATIYYAQRSPQSLSDFHWLVDAKHHEITPYENLWTKIIMPALQSKSLRETFIQVIGADYSFFSKYCSESSQPPAHLNEAVRSSGTFKYVRINDIYRKNLSFEQSHESFGVQLADILTTTIRRAMIGNLGIDGWIKIGKLMVEPLRRPSAIQLIDISSESAPSYEEENPPYWHVLPTLDALRKPLLVDIQ